MRTELDLFKGKLWHPMREFSDLQKNLNRIFEDSDWLHSFRKSAPEAVQVPACDVEETEDRYLLAFDLPGMEKEEIKVEMIDRDLVISAEHMEEKKEEKKSRHVIERYYGNYRRVITLPKSVDADQIQATFENGVLRLKVPKVETSRTKQINISDGKSASPTQSQNADIKRAQQVTGSSVRIA